ncbi:hypothetical protein NDU88_004656 [Pleurodeles waltl]|uniref:Uncharacterized protein n=1 Tax=Pleurodeles waltl TaxID=8319 RepID=A0AAV7W7B1_PLEWA|nr:hypothetical protein NDU88_004656 [Pleurodeles waltl]
MLRFAAEAAQDPGRWAACVAQTAGKSAHGSPRAPWLIDWWAGEVVGPELPLRVMCLGLSGKSDTWSCPAAAFCPGQWRTLWCGELALTLLMAWVPFYFIEEDALEWDSWPCGSGGGPHALWPLALLPALETLWRCLFLLATVLATW